MYYFLEQHGHPRLSDMVHVVFVDLGVLELDCVWQKAAETTSPLNYSGNGHSEHQVIGLNVIFFLLFEVLMIFEMLRCLLPWQSLPKNTPRSLMI